MGGSAEKCPDCDEYMEVGRLMGWNEQTKKNDIIVTLVEDELQFGISVQRCRKCHHVELSLN